MSVTLSDAPWPCAVCRRPLQSSGGLTGIPAAIYPEKHEPLHVLAGRFLHKDCLDRHPAREQLQADMDQFYAAVKRRQCVVCEQAIDLGKGGFSTQRLGPATGPQGALNYLQFHAACLPKYDGLEALSAAVTELEREAENPVGWLRKVRTIVEEACSGIAPVGTIFFQ